MEKHALIVTHGQPSDPAPAEANLARVAARIAAHLPDWRVGSATLAAPDALRAATAGLGAHGLVYPMFMSCGWFTGTHLPERLLRAGAADWRVTIPLGCNPGLQALCIAMVQAAMTRPAAETDLILAAHGSGRSDQPALIAMSVARMIGRALGLRRVQAAFIDQSPRIADLSGFGEGALCLPYFAADGGHVQDDIPQALQNAGFRGRLLPPVGTDLRVTVLVAQTLRHTWESSTQR
jgi:sirohydrochlorin ferrochelatase